MSQVPVASQASWSSIASAAVSSAADASTTLASAAKSVVTQANEPATSTAAATAAAAAATAYTDDRNPLIALIDGLLRVVLASLNLIRILATFSTITVPSLVYTILHYSLTLQLNFPSLALLFLTSLVSAFIWLRYRHLNKYERLREVPLTRDEGFNLNPDVASAGGDNDRGSFHNYLDDFLQAIRIFGFLEKPVFHELARHLQTRRLVAGDSLSLDTDCSFYIVIDGHVQVYAPLPSATASAVGQDSVEDEDDNGYQLLNEVESGGTLSSLFTILSLFTEDVKLSFGDDDSHSGPHHLGTSSMDRHYNFSAGQYTGRGNRSTPGADNSTAPTSPYASAFNPPSQTAAQLQLNAAALRNVPAAMTTEGAVERLGGNAVRTGPKSSHSRTASSGTGSMTVQDGDTSTIMDPHESNDDSGTNSLGHAPDLQMPPAQASAPFSHFAPGYNASPAGTPMSSLPSTSQSPYFRGRATSIHALHEANPGGPHTPGSILSAMSNSGHGHFAHPGDPLHRQGAGTVARATVDTTLAVIPAEAFKRLTKKFPNAAAHIVQVILARLSRVTFHTAHKYLGLTKEVMRTEKSINDLACFPLPSEFYEKGGMDKLRHRFLPQPTSKRESTSIYNDDDYFRNFQEWTSTTQRSSTPVPTGRETEDGSPSKVRIAVDPPTLTTSPKQTAKKAPSRISTAKTPWGHPDPPLKTPTARTMVGPGDLLSMASLNEDGWHTSGFDIHSAQPTPRAKPRSVSKLEPFHGPLPHPMDDSTSGTSPRSGISPITQRNGTGGSGGESHYVDDLDGEHSFSNIGLAHFDIKNEVMDCIAKSIGLAQAVASPIATSYQASPHISAQDSLLQRSVFKSAFSSLSMLDAAMAEEESSITGTNSSMAGHGPSGFHPSDFENEVEIKFFPAGSTLVKAGESRAGLFYVIDGFLDILLPADANELEEEDRAPNSKSAGKGRGASTGTSSSNQDKASSHRKAPSNASLRTGRNGEDAAWDAGTSRTQRRGTDADRTSSVGEGTTPSLHRPAGREGSSSSASYGNASGLRKRPSESAKVGNALDGTGGAGSSGSRKPSISTGTGANLACRNSDATATKVPAAAKLPTRPPLQQPHRGNPPQQQRQQQSGHRGKEGKRSIFTVGRGGIAGYLSSLLGTASYVDITAKTDVYVGFLPAHALERIMERRPIVLLTLCKRLLSLLPPLILHIDSSLDWQQVNAGQVIYREDDPSDSFFIVINGRLRAITEKSNGIEVHNEYGQGDSVGELDVITNSRRRTTLHAIRDSELAKMPSTLFNAISVRHPAITIQISRIIARRVRAELIRSKQEGAALGAPIPGLPDLGRNNLNLKTVAIVPVTRQVPVIDFAAKLQTAFDDTIGGRAIFLDQSSVMGVLGRHAFSRMGKLKLAGWLADLEQKYRMVVYVVDTPVSSAWSQTSIRQADCVLMVGFGDEPAMGEYERLLMSVKTTARKELVLLHPERSVPPGSTREWLKNRPWVHAHHHVEMTGLAGSHAAAAISTGGDPKAVKALRNLKQKLETSLQRYRKTKAPLSASGRPHHASDFARLARRLCGMSIGLVLGGGGARGCAHLGVIRALEERGIPIDMVGGTSIGSLVGGLYAREAEMVSTFGRAKRFAGRMASLWRFASDLTYPVVSYTTGHEFNRGVFKAIQETHIEDMWIPFFCNTTNITWSRMEVHTSGYAWRYIRGSMTLAGLIPPLVDEGNMLVDGGYVDNLPVTVMLAMGARSVFAVDVGSIDDTSPRAYGDTLSGWWVLLNRWNPWSDAGKIPSIPDIQGRLTYVSSVKTLEEAKKVKGCFYMRMPVEEFGTLAFGRFDMIYEKGYKAAVDLLDGWDAEGKLPSGTERGEFEDDDEEEEYEVYTDDEGVGGVRRRVKKRRRTRRKAGISARRNSI